MSRGSGRVYNECKNCSSARADAWKRRFPNRAVDHHRRRRYGMAPGEYEARLLEQEGRCAICHTDDPGAKKGWHVDHDHLHGHVRGILCHGCNTGLGGFKDIPERLERAAAYLRQHGSADPR